MFCYVIYFVLCMVVFGRRLRRTLADIEVNNIAKSLVFNYLMMLCVLCTGPHTVR